MDAVLRHGRRRNGQNVLLDLPGQTLQGQPNGLGVHFIQLVQDQFRDRNGLQVRVTTAAADVQDVGARGLQAHGVGVNEQLLEIRAELQCGGEAGLGKVARIERRGKTYNTSRFNWSSVKNARLIPASVIPNWAAFIATVKAALLL